MENGSLPRQVALAALGGTMLFVGFVGFGQLYLSWFCFVPALVALRDATPRRAILLGTVYGGVFTVGGFYWIMQLLHQFASLNWGLAFLGLLLLSLYQGLGVGLAFWFVRKAQLVLGWSPIWSLGLAITAVEFAFPLLFPYYFGASQFRFVAITQIVELVGMVGLGTVITLMSGAWFELLEARRERRRIVRARVLVPLGLFFASLAYGAARIPAVDRAIAEAPKLKVAVVQTNLGAKDKEARASEFILRHVEMSKRAIAEQPDIDLVVWPESAYNRWIPRGTTNVSRMVTKGVDRPVLFGALTWEGGEDAPLAYNSAILTSSTGDVLGIFDKVVLLAFGEKVPLAGVFPILKKWFPAGFTPGSRFELMRLPDGTSMLPMICYEDIIPAMVRDFWLRAGPPDVLVNVTNDSWYGDSHEPIEHLALATFRTIETRRALIRSTNTGISALVDPVGRLTGRTGQWTQETLIGEVPLMRGGATTVYLRFGDWVGWSSLAGVVFALARIIQARRRRR